MLPSISQMCNKIVISFLSRKTNFGMSYSKLYCETRTNIAGVISNEVEAELNLNG